MGNLRPFCQGIQYTRRRFTLLEKYVKLYIYIYISGLYRGYIAIMDKKMETIIT